MDIFTRFTRVKTPQNNFSDQNFSVENNYCGLFLRVKRVNKTTIQLFESKSLELNVIFSNEMGKSYQDL